MEKPSWFHWLVLVAGILYLLADLAVFDWGVSWWTAAFLLIGLAGVANQQ